MYCSSCGVAVAQGLIYCNHCGARLTAAKDAVLPERSEVSADSLVWAIVSVFVAGLGVIIGLMAVMKNILGFDRALIIFISLLSFLLLIIVEAMFMWLLLTRKTGSREKEEPKQLREQSAKELPKAQARVLAEPLKSVTEHTTRAFDPIYRERTPK